MVFVTRSDTEIGKGATVARRLTMTVGEGMAKRPDWIYLMAG
jgi:hypothetical protein